jgi:DNA adenine methylase
MTEVVPSLVKWTGGKRSQAARIAALAPRHTRYLEPFLGGGAVLWFLARPGSVAGDDYRPLVDLWRLVAVDPGAVVEAYRGSWRALQADLPGHFYVVRERFNRAPNPTDLGFLLRTCVNGIVRFNEAGEFNNSFHLSRRGMHPDRFAGIVDRWHRRLAGVDLRCADFEETIADAGPGDFVYLDPPYLETRQRYQTGPEPARLFAALHTLNRSGARWALSYDGRRGQREYAQAVPRKLFRRRISLASGLSAVGKVLNDSLEGVEEALYLSY